MIESRQIPLGAVLLLSALAANAQVPSASGAAPPGTVALSSLIATVASRTGRKFVLRPGALKASVALLGEDPSSVTYDQLLTILDTYGFAAVETGGYVRVLPAAEIREQPLPVVSDKDKRPDGEYVTTVFHVRSLPAGWLVPILRPILPQQAHLAAMPCVNDLLIVDRFANVRRIESIVEAMDTGQPIKPQTCAVSMPQTPMPRRQ